MARPARVRHEAAATGENADALAVALLDAEAARLVVRRVDEHDRRTIDVAFLLDDSAGTGATTAGLQVALLDADALPPNATPACIE